MERLRGKKNVYEQIVEEYARFIRTGALKEGESSPPAARSRRSSA